MTDMSKADVLTINKDDVELSPFPHCFKHPFVRPDLFARLKDEFPKDEFFDRNTSLGGRAGRDLYPGDELYDELLSTSSAWKEFSDYIDSEKFVGLVLDMFGNQLKSHGCSAEEGEINYEKWVESREILAQGSTRVSRMIGKIKNKIGISDKPDETDPNKMFVRMDIAQGDIGYEKVAHCDRSNRLISMLIYFCNKEDIGMEGGTFRVHKHKAEKKIEDYERHPSPSDLDIVASFEPKENFGGIFIGCNNSYHSATAVTKSNGYRNFVYTSVASRSRSLWKSSQ